MNWTAKELKLILKGLRKHVKCRDWLKRTAVLLKDRDPNQIKDKMSQIRKRKQGLSPVEKEIVAVMIKRNNKH